MILYQKHQLGGAMRMARRAGKAVGNWAKRNYNEIVEPESYKRELKNQQRAADQKMAQRDTGGNDAFDTYFDQADDVRGVDTDAWLNPSHWGGTPGGGQAQKQYQARLGEIDYEMTNLTQWGRQSKADFQKFNELRQERDMLLNAMR